MYKTATQVTVIGSEQHLCFCSDKLFTNCLCTMKSSKVVTLYHRHSLIGMH